MDKDLEMIEELRRIGTEPCVRLAEQMDRFVRDPEGFRVWLLDAAARGGFGPRPGESDEAFVQRIVENSRHIGRDLILEARGME